MSNTDNARRAYAQIIFNGTDISSDIRPYLLSAEYTDNEEDESDDLQLTLQDREAVWLSAWMLQAIEAASNSQHSITISAKFICSNWDGSGKNKVLNCGKFELDSISCSGPPSVITIKAVALPYSSKIRQTKRSKAWENYYLSKIAKEMASRNKMKAMFLSETDPFYSRTEQYRQSDIAFLSTLCHRSGMSLKVTNGTLVIFDQSKYEKQGPALKFSKGDGTYLKYKFSTGKADTEYDLCRVSYVDPSTGKSISGVAYKETDDKDEDENTSKSKEKEEIQELNIHAKVRSVGEAQTLAAKMLRMHNKYAKSLSITTPGNTDAVAGVTVTLSRFGMFNGKYLIKKAKHQIGSSGYTTTIDMRPSVHDYEPEKKKSEKATSTSTATTEFKVGAVVQFKGGSHYASSDANRAARTGLKAGPAKITSKNPGSKHPWHLVHTDSKSAVYGWVDDGTFS